MAANLQMFKLGDESLGLFVVDGAIYVEDVLEAFDIVGQGIRFRADSMAVLLMKDKNRQIMKPERIAHHPGSVIEITLSTRAPSSTSIESVNSKPISTPPPIAPKPIVFSAPTPTRSNPSHALEQSAPPPSPQYKQTALTIYQKSIPSITLTTKPAENRNNGSVTSRTPDDIEKSTGNQYKGVRSVLFSKPAKEYAIRIEADSTSDTVHIQSEPPVRPPPGSTIAPVRPLHIRKVTSSSPPTTISAVNKDSTLLSQQTTRPMTATALTRQNTIKAKEQLDKVHHAIVTASQSGRALNAIAIQGLAEQNLGSLKDVQDEDFKTFVRKRLDELYQQGEVQQKKMETMLSMQQQALDRLSLIQNKAEAILRQNFELLEYTIPRLFIILPDEKATKWDPANLFRNKFRLHFICECGEHTKTPSSKINHHLHLAKHDGYVIRQPTEFFARYSPFLRVMLETIKVGMSVAGIVVPALSSLRVSDMLDKVQQATDGASKNVIDRVDQSLAYLEKLRTETELGTPVTSSSSDIGIDSLAAYLAGVEGIEGAELRQLANYLQADDSGNMLGNMYRITNSEGRVFWVCSDHYREGYQAHTTKALKDLLTVVRGDFNEQLGKITISLGSSTAASQFYETVGKVSGIAEMDISWTWNQSYNDMVAFRNLICRSNIQALTVQFKEETLAGFTPFGKKRYDPMMEVIKHGSLRWLYFKTIHADFCKRATFEGGFSNLKTLKWPGLFSGLQEVALIEKVRAFLWRSRCLIALDLCCEPGDDDDGEGIRDKDNKQFYANGVHEDEKRLAWKCAVLQKFHPEYDVLLTSWFTMARIKDDDASNEGMDISQLVVNSTSVDRVYKYFVEEQHVVGSEIAAMALNVAVEKLGLEKVERIKVSTAWFSPSAVREFSILLRKLNRLKSLVLDSHHYTDKLILDGLPWHSIQDFELKNGSLLEKWDPLHYLQTFLTKNDRKLYLQKFTYTDEINMDDAALVMSIIAVQRRLSMISFRLNCKVKDGGVVYSSIVSAIDFSKLESLVLDGSTVEDSKVQQVLEAVIEKRQICLELFVLDKAVIAKRWIVMWNDVGVCLQSHI